MASSDSAYVDEDVYTRESTDLDGIVRETEQDRIHGWHALLDLVQRAGVPIIAPEELTGGPACRILGRGATMVVSECVWRTSDSREGCEDQKPPAVVAVKRLVVRFAASEHDLHSRPQHELALLANFTLELRALSHGALRSHANIVRLFGITWAEKGLPALVVERASERFPTLQSLVENQKLRGVQKADMLAGITDGLVAMHSLTLVHGDLKPANVLIFEEGTNIVPKLADFAFSRSWRESLPSGGTEYWNAPECCEFSLQETKDDEGHPSYRDLFSLGLVFWYVLNDKLPFADIGEEIDKSNETRRKITAAKESGYLLKELRANAKSFEAFMWESELTEAVDDDDAILSIVECVADLLQPQPSRRLKPGYGSISEKLRTRRRLLETSKLTWNGTTLSGDIWPGIEKDLEELKLGAESQSKVETSIRYNFAKELGSASSTHRVRFDKENISSDVLTVMKTTHDATLRSKDASREERAEAAWYLAQLAGPNQPKRRQELMLEAAKLGNQCAQANHLFLCLRDSVAIAVDAEAHMEWLVTSLTGDLVFKELDTYPASSPLRKRVFRGFHDFYAKADAKNKTNAMNYEGAETKNRIAVLHEAFVRDVLGATYPAHHQVLIHGKGWGTIISAKKGTFEEFRAGIGSLGDGINPDALHHAAVYGTGSVVRDLVQRHKVNMEITACTSFHPGLATALQAAFLRRNMSTVEALVNLGADILPLFTVPTLQAFLIEGDRDLLHWLNHLIPLIRNGDSAAKARVAFDSELLSSRAVQCTVVQSNWSLFLGILELRPPLTDEELKDALELAACTRRSEFVLALLVLDSEYSNISRETLIHILCQACQPRQADVARKPIFPRYYLGLNPELIQSVKKPHDIAYGRLIAEIVLHVAMTPFKSRVGDPRSFMQEPLIQAVLFNRMPLARWFISDWGADPVQQSKDGETILSLAVYRRKFHAVTYILTLPGASKMIESRNFLGDGPIHLAATERDPRIIKTLLDAGASPTSRRFLDRNVLHLCASHVNKRAFCTLFDRIEQSSPSILRTMMNQKDSFGTTPLHFFLQGSDPNPGTTCKSPASRDRDMERILSTKILKYIDDINVPDKWDLTPLHYLALFNDDMPETAMLLCRRGADLLRQSSRIGATPFQILTGRDRVAGIGFLVSAMSSSTISPAFVRRALEEGRPDFDKINRVLEERLQILKQQEAKMSEQLRAEFNARHSKPRATDIIEPTE